jgi:saccharopine dehydrogenase (NADP+, L-glutamate forming)
MNRALVLGAGLVAPPLVRHLLQKGVALTIACNNPDRAREISNGKASIIDWDAGDDGHLQRLIADSDVVVSLLPTPMHTPVAKRCVMLRRHFIASSFTPPEMKELDQPAQDAGVVLLNEIGLDPGIDHMSAMQLISRVKAQGGRIVSFKSSCGGIPAPEANDNPLGYKFSWTPMGVLRAFNSPARFLWDGVECDIPAGGLSQNISELKLPELKGTVLEDYPNRDFLQYIPLYGLEGIQTMYRGTLRYPGWTETMDAAIKLGLLSDDTPRGATWDAAVAARLDLPVDQALPMGVARFLGISPASPAIMRLSWLGVLSSMPIDPQAGSFVEALAALMSGKLVYRKGERDLVVLHHEFIAAFPTHRERITATLVAYGIPHGDSAMSLTVGIPMAAATLLLLMDHQVPAGLQVPTIAPLYDTLLPELTRSGLIHFDERTEKLDD